MQDELDPAFDPDFPPLVDSSSESEQESEEESDDDEDKNQTVSEAKQALMDKEKKKQGDKSLPDLRKKIWAKADKGLSAAAVALRMKERKSKFGDDQRIDVCFATTVAGILGDSSDVTIDPFDTSKNNGVDDANELLSRRSSALFREIAFSTQAILKTSPDLGRGDPLPKDFVMPTTFAQATNGPFGPQFLAAHTKEFSGLEQAGVFVVVPEAEATSPLVGNKTIYSIKTLADGSIDKFKVRGVAQGFSQVDGLNFDSTNTYSPVVSIMVVRMLLTIFAGIAAVTFTHLDIARFPVG